MSAELAGDRRQYSDISRRKRNKIKMYLVCKTYFVFSKYHGGRDQDRGRQRQRRQREREIPRVMTFHREI